MLFFDEVVDILCVSVVAGVGVFYVATLYVILLNKIDLIKSCFFKQIFSTGAYVVMCAFLVIPIFIITGRDGATLNWSENASMYFITCLGYLIAIVPAASYYYFKMVKGKKQR